MSDFQHLRIRLAPYIQELCERWLPDGRRQGKESVARNPRRADDRIGSFSVNVYTGKWSDFATGDSGCDIISLAAYLHFPHAEQPQLEAYRSLAGMIGMPV